MSKRDFSWQRMRKRRVCPKCGANPKFLGVNGNFEPELECKKCGNRFTGTQAKVIEE